MASVIISNKRSKPRVKILSPNTGNISYSRSVSLCSTGYHSDYAKNNYEIYSDSNEIYNESNTNNTSARFANCNETDIQKNNATYNNNKNIIVNDMDVNDKMSKKETKKIYSNINKEERLPQQHCALAVIDSNRLNTISHKVKQSTLNNLFNEQNKLHNDSSMTKVVLNSSMRSSLSVSSIKPNLSRSVSLLSHENGVSDDKRPTNLVANTSSIMNKNVKTKKNKSTSYSLGRKGTSYSGVYNPNNQNNSNNNNSNTTTTTTITTNNNNNNRNNRTNLNEVNYDNNVNMLKSTKNTKELSLTKEEQLIEKESEPYNYTSERVDFVHELLSKAGEHIMRKNLSIKYATQLQAQQEKARHLLFKELNLKRYRSECIEEERCNKHNRNYDDIDNDNDNDDDDDDRVFYLERDEKMRYHREMQREEREQEKQLRKKSGENVCKTERSSLSQTNSKNCKIQGKASNACTLPKTLPSKSDNVETCVDERSSLALTRYNNVCPGMFHGLSALTLPDELFDGVDELVTDTKSNNCNISARQSKLTKTTAQGDNKYNIKSNSITNESTKRNCTQLLQHRRCCVKPVWSLVGTFKCGLTSFVDVDFNQQCLR